MSTVIEIPTAVDLVPAETPPPLPSSALMRFNRMFLDRKDPVEGTGINLEKFSYALTYRVAREKHAGVIDALYRSVYARLKDNSIPLAHPVVVDYDDARTGTRERPRRYIVVRGDTLRSTHMDVFVTFLSYGDYLYISIDSFMLPPLSFMRVLWTYFAALAVTSWAWLFTGPIGFTFVTCPVLAWWNRDVVRSLRHGDPVGIAFRRHYYKWKPESAFDNDDVLSYFKSTTLLISEAISTVFEANGISIAELQQIRRTINLTTNFHNSGNMNVFGSLLVGLGNAVGGAGKN